VGVGVDVGGGFVILISGAALMSLIHYRHIMVDGQQSPLH